MIKELIKKGFRTIRKHWILFIILFITQILFLVILGYTGVHYYIGAIDNANAMLEQVSGLSAEQILGMQIPEPYQLYENYKAMLYNVYMGIFMVFAVFLLFEGINWNITNTMVNKARHLKDILWYHLKYAILFLIFTIPYLLILLALFRTIAATGSNAQFILGAIAFGLIDAYFLAISLGICHKYKLKDLLVLLKRAFYLGGASWTIFLMSVIIVIVYILAGTLLYYSAVSLGLLVLAAALFILVVNWGRITCMTTVKEIEEKKK